MPGAFESYARRVLSAVWAHGRLPDAALIRGVFEALDVDPDRFFNDINERESFQFQDACLQDALSVGVFVGIDTVSFGVESADFVEDDIEQGAHYRAADEQATLGTLGTLRAAEALGKCSSKMVL